MKIHDLKPPPGSKKARRRVGRGIAGKGGKTAGRGMKGQHARGTVPVGFEGGQMPLARRLPKRGFRNHSKVSYQVVSLDRLERFAAGTVVDEETLRRERIVRRRGPIKLLADGEIAKALTIKVAAVSAKAREKIVAAGGTVEVEGS